LTSGPINDGGWNTKAYEGLLLLEEEFGYEIGYTENVKQDEQVMIAQEYARKGYDLVIGHGYEFGDSLAVVAPDFPDVYFVNVGGTSGGAAPNLASGVFENGVLGYLAGRLGAELTETNRIGFVGAMEIPTVINEVTAMIAAAEYYNPDIKVSVTYTGSWVDVAAGKEAALAMIADDYDYIVAIGDAANTGVIQAADEKGIWAVGWAGDMHDLAPDRVATSFVQSVSAVIEYFALNIENGTWVGEALEFGVPEATQFVGTWADGVPQEIKDNIMADFAKFESGEYSKSIVEEMTGISE